MEKLVLIFEGRDDWDRPVYESNGQLYVCLLYTSVMKCDKFKGKGFDAFLMSQMWDCQEDRERIFRECKYQVVATDMLAAALPALERANLDADFLNALVELCLLYTSTMTMTFSVLLSGCRHPGGEW